MSNLITRRFNVTVELPATELGGYIHTPYPELPGFHYNSYAVSTTVITKPALEQHLTLLESDWEGSYDDESFKVALNVVLTKVRTTFNLPHTAIQHHNSGMYKPVVAVTDCRPFFAGDDLSVRCKIDAGNVSFTVTCSLYELISKVYTLYEASGLHKLDEFNEAFLEFLSRTPAKENNTTTEVILSLGLHKVTVEITPFS